MLKQKFYHSTVRKTIVAFGNLFNNIVIDRKDDQGDVIQSVRVPLSYSPQQPFLAKILQQPVAEDAKFQIVLPRMSFEMVSVTYDPTRKVAPTQQNRASNQSGVTQDMQYAPAPYNLGMLLYIYAKNQEDGLQVVEQILPYFNPDFNLTVKAIPELNLKHDLPILLDSVSYDDQYEGDFTTRRMITWTMSFTVKTNFFGPVSQQGYIKSATTNTFTGPDMLTTSARYNVQTDSDPGSVPPVNYIETFEEF